MIITKKEIIEGQRIPRGYGIAYVNYEKLTFVIYPIPLNHVIGWIRALLFFSRHRKMLRHERDLYLYKRANSPSDYLWN